VFNDLRNMFDRIFRAVELEQSARYRRVRNIMAHLRLALPRD
jgi:hypothetical protein